MYHTMVLLLLFLFSKLQNRRHRTHTNAQSTIIITINIQVLCIRAQHAGRRPNINYGEKATSRRRDGGEGSALMRFARSVELIAAQSIDTLAPSAVQRRACSIMARLIPAFGPQMLLLLSFSLLWGVHAGRQLGNLQVKVSRVYVFIYIYYLRVFVYRFSFFIFFCFFHYLLAIVLLHFFRYIFRYSYVHISIYMVQLVCILACKFLHILLCLIIYHTYLHIYVCANIINVRNKLHFFARLGGNCIIRTHVHYIDTI